VEKEKIQVINLLNELSQGAHLSLEREVGTFFTSGQVVSKERGQGSRIANFGLRIAD
jgi:hypothetical protein